MLLQVLELALTTEVQIKETKKKMGQQQDLGKGQEQVQVQGQEQVQEQMQG